MTAIDGPSERDADDPALADLFDSMLQQLLDGQAPEPDQLLPDRPDLRARVRETFELACAVAGRREPGRPVLGGYEIVRELGRGGMGTVYLARHQALEREVAIKVLPQSLALSARAKRRFLEEARSLARLRHEHIVHIHRIVDHSEMLAFEMEYVEGPSLQSLLLELRQHGPRPSPEQLARALGPAASSLGVRSTVEYFAKLGIAIARALSEVHRCGLVHRDVKPSNILLRKNGTPVLADFGLAQDDDPTSTQTVSFAGTPIYAAPERLRHGDLGLDGRADVYSLGVTLYEAITLSPPYQGRSTQEVLRKIESGSIVPLRQRAPHVSRDLQTVLQKAMEGDPRHRYATADEFADDLERLLALQPIRAKPKGPLRRLALATHRHRKLLVAAGVSAALVALAFWPMMVHAQAAANAAERAAQFVHSAHVQMLEPECLDLADWGGASQMLPGSIAVPRQIEALQRAKDAYDQALAIDTDNQCLLAERSAVATAIWLRTEPPGNPEFAAAARASAGFRAAVADLPPTALHAARMLVGGSIDRAELRPLLASAATVDRFALGLLAALLGDLATCEAAWLPLDGAAFDHPLLDAGLGRLYAAEGFPERAYPRLFHATRSLPMAPALALELADAALATGDLELAEQWLAHPSLAPATNGEVPATATRRWRRVNADLLATHGDRGGAEAAYRSILDQWPDDLIARHRLATLAAERGDLPRARQHLQRILEVRPDHAQAHLDLARLALHNHDRPGYLAEVRYAVAHSLSHDASCGAADQLAEILRLGGMRDLQAVVNTDTAAHRRDWRHLEPITTLWKSTTELDGIEAMARVLADFDRAVARASTTISNPLAATMRALQQVAAEHGEILRPLPLLGRAALSAAWPWLVTEFADSMLIATTPLMRNLGSAVQVIQVQSLVQQPQLQPAIDYAQSLSTLGCVDGTERLLIGAVPRRETDARGWVEVRTTIDRSLLATLPSPRSGLMFGYCLADVGDLDGDGVRDFAVGAPQSRTDPEVAAAVFLYSGRDHTLLRELRGTDPVAFGVAVTGLGDVDGDGVPDLAVGSAPFRRSTMALGRVTVFSGRTGDVVRTHDCDRAGAAFGAALTNPGDVDGDGVDDLVVSGNLGGSTPLVRVYSGRTGADLMTIDQRLGHDFGRSVLGLGDVAGDGKVAIAIAAPDLDNRDNVPGRVLFCDARTGALIGELIGDATGDQFGAAMCCLPDWCGNRSPAIAVGATRGGITGRGYVRVFDRASRVPLQTFFSKPDQAQFGAPILSLGAHDSLERPRLAIVSRDQDHGTSILAMWFCLDQPPGPPEPR